VGGTDHLGMNSKAHSENPFQRVQEVLEVQEIFDIFSSTLYGFELLASEFIPRWTRNEAENLSGDEILSQFTNSILRSGGQLLTFTT
jgi:hypothetical protein